MIAPHARNVTLTNMDKCNINEQRTNNLTTKPKRNNNMQMLSITYNIFSSYIQCFLVDEIEHATFPYLYNKRLGTIQ